MICTYHRVTHDELVAYVQGLPRAKKRRGNPGSSRKKKYKSEVGAFDIETSRIGELTFMYVWAFGIHDRITTGRTWTEFVSLMDRLSAACGDDALIIGVHNLAYEWQFIKYLHPFDEEDVFLMDSRKPLFVKWGQIELRCTYKWSNMSLARLTESTGTPWRKKSGEAFDYSEVRYPDTPLTSGQWLYQLYDVIGLIDSMERKMELDGDNVYTLPYTSTGYTRRDCRAAMRPYRKTLIPRILPTYDQFLALREGFRGGNTHANRWYAGRIIDGPVHSVDKASSYPTSMLMRLPMSAFSHVQSPDPEFVFDQIRQGRAVLARVRLWNVTLKVRAWGAPYLPISKCRNVIRPIIDNGRILDCKMLETTVTDIDLKIIADEYDFEIDFLEIWTARYGSLPAPFVDVILKYFERKTALKSSDPSDSSAAYYYGQQKARLNAAYGMCVTNTLRVSYRFRDGEEVIETPGRAEYDAAMKKQFLSYAWGVWITAHSRADLERAIRHVHDTPGADFLYCDTDSVKYVGSVDWSAFNRKYIRAAERCGAVAEDRKGRKHYLGIWEDDGTYDQFITLGAKKYASRTGRKISLTVSGVNPKAGARELRKLENFKEGFVFTTTAAGMTALYVDDQRFEVREIDGHRVELTSYVSLLPSEYTLGLAGDYKKLLSDPAWYLEAFDGKSY